MGSYEHFRITQQQPTIPFGLTIITTALAAISCGIIALIATSSAKHIVSDEVQQRFSAIRDTAAEQLTDWYGQRAGDVQVLAQSADVIMLHRALDQYLQDMEVGSEQDVPVDNPEYKALWKTGEHLVDYMNIYGYYDVFLTTADGLVVYAGAREADLGANLEWGRFQDSGLAKCWSTIMETHDISLTDTEPYAPSADYPAQFMGYPLAYDGEIQGAVILQISQEGIDHIVQRDFGTGETGETYLVGQDHLMRSNSRLVAEYADDDTVLMQKCDQDYVDASLAGETGFLFAARDYDGVPCFTAYGFVDLPGGLRWAIVSEIYQSEALAPLHTLVSKLVMFSFAVVILAALVGFVYERRTKLDNEARLVQQAQALHTQYSGKGASVRGARGGGRDTLTNAAQALATAAEALEEHARGMDR